MTSASPLPAPSGTTSAAGPTPEPQGTPPRPPGIGRFAAWCWLLVVPAGGLAVDLWQAHPPGLGLGVALLAASGFVAARMRVNSLGTPVVGPPIATAVVLVGAMVVVDGFDGMRAIALGLATQLALFAPWVWSATVLAALIVLVRRFRRRAARGAERTGGSPRRH